MIGAKNGVRQKMPFLICVVCGVMTTTFGGLVRDTLAKRPIRILHSHAEVYATAAGAGAVAYLTARKMRMGLAARISAGFLTAAAVRLAAVTQGLRLPTWSKRDGKWWQVQWPASPTK